ncbi:MAG: CZB domain-containing protein, partial [Spirochaetales bacterium]|nr:CZB domain-containing protein [Spirochaetales bacterium]
MFKAMTIGKRIGLGFGIIMLLLGILGLTSYTGISGIVSNAVSMITGSNVQEVMKQKEIDHLNWLNSLTEYMQDYTVEELHLQTNDHLCGLGKWLYSEDRKKAEEAVPALVPILKAMEEPHRLLHTSAIDIEKKMLKLDVKKLVDSLFGLQAAHVQWHLEIMEDLFKKDTRLSVEMDHTQCGLGRWFKSESVKELTQKYPAFNSLVNQLRDPHEVLHETGKIVNNKLKAGDVTGVIEAHHQIHAAYEKTMRVVKEIQKWTWGIEESQEEANRIFNEVSVKNIHKVQSLMHEVVDVVNKNMITQELLLGGASKNKTIIMVLGIGA